jgi:hypothetical protein
MLGVKFSQSADDFVADKWGTGVPSISVQIKKLWLFDTLKHKKFDLV